jgi:CheY-like chemotaxis protein
VHVLLVEDDPIQQRLVTAQLDLESISALAIGALEDARGALRSRSFDAVLLDLGLPDSDGLATLLAVRALTTVPIVVLSGDGAPETERLILQAGAQDYLVKGETAPRQIARALRIALDRARLEHELEEARAREEQDRELLHLDRLAYGVVPLRISHPVEFRGQAQLYGDLIHLAARGADGHGKLRAIAEALHALDARPRDCIELHKEVLMQTSPQTTMAPEYLEHSRLCLLDLVCELCLLYRSTSHERGLELRVRDADLESLRIEVRELSAKVAGLQDQLFELGSRQARTLEPLALAADYGAEADSVDAIEEPLAGGDQ